MQYSKQGLALTASFESCRLKAYQDVRGIWTIGYGHTAGVQEGQVCTQEQAELWLAGDIGWAEGVVNHLVTVPLTQGEFDALVDFVFNLGSGNFSHSTLLKLVNQHDMERAAQEFEKWDMAGGKHVAGLLRRRQAEAAEFSS